ncbi:hypothetical protein HPB52_015836 [Rhipicephalus sanguineus]|uniref:Ubiquitin-conjugating enzyme E2 Z n=1 Tax=Rhipicephalus sanguineus TaxID=34632 RepID=A0A9D4PC02_RHISA|nr:hypothetical protein HPB52_015836 [Rhipicephalus sanguineus]
MKLDTPATDWCDDDITAIGDELLDDEMEGPLNEDFAPWVDTASDSSDNDDELDGPPVGETPRWPQTTCPKDYPMRPPRVRLMNTDDGSVSFNPNLYKSGRVCLDILGTSDTLAWSPAHSISSVVVSIQSLLTKKPHFNEANWISELRPEDCGSYSRIVQHETIRVAVCDAIDACLNGCSLCPGYLEGVMLEHFMAHYEKYEKVVESSLYLTGEDMMDPLFFETYGRGQYQYESLLVKLRKMKAQVEDLMKALHVGEQ